MKCLLYIWLHFSPCRDSKGILGEGSLLSEVSASVKNVGGPAEELHLLKRSLLSCTCSHPVQRIYAKAPLNLNIRESTLHHVLIAHAIALCYPEGDYNVQVQ